MSKFSNLVQKLYSVSDCFLSSSNIYLSCSLYISLYYSFSFTFVPPSPLFLSSVPLYFLSILVNYLSPSLPCSIFLLYFLSSRWLHIPPLLFILSLSPFIPISAFPSSCPSYFSLFLLSIFSSPLSFQIISVILKTLILPLSSIPLFLLRVSPSFSTFFSSYLLYYYKCYIFHLPCYFLSNFTFLLTFSLSHHFILSLVCSSSS